MTRIPFAYSEVQHAGDLSHPNESPGDALLGWLRAFIAHVAAKREPALAILDDQGGRCLELLRHGITRSQLIPPNP